MAVSLGQIIKMPVFRVTLPCLNLWCNLDFFQVFWKKKIIHFERPFKLQNIVFVQKKKKKKKKKTIKKYPYYLKF